MDHKDISQTSVIIIGAGFSGISAAKKLSDAGIKNLTILEATSRIGGRICKKYFYGANVEVGANWIEGVHGKQENPIWEMAEKVGLRTFYSDYSKLSSNTYKQTGRALYDKTEVQEAIDLSDNVHEAGQKLSQSLPPSGWEDISVVPSKPLDMVVDYLNYDYEFAEPPRVTSLQNTNPLPTFANFGDDVYFVADKRGYESLVYDVAREFLKHRDNDESGTSGVIVDPRLHFNKDKKILALNSFDMAVYTKIFLKFPSKFWPEDSEFFLYTCDRRGYYPIWQQLENEYPGENILMVTVTDNESRRIEQHDKSKIKDEAMQVLKNMFGDGIPDATDILVPRWWSNRFFKGCFSNWPVGVNRYEFDLMKAPFGRVHFTGEHTSELYNGYVHGAYLAGIDSAKLLLKCIEDSSFKFEVKPKDA
ncbi:hypothetical protein LUZ60_006085 [Juncus effusus]|nr:hypothetical protein LUZ60_006085 [Juncus effusus]